MPIGSPMFRPRTGSDRLTHGAWGVQPSGPLVSPVKAPLTLGRATPAVPSGPGGGPLGLPSKDALDYVHSLTQTSLLVVGTVAFLVLYRHRPHRALRKLTGKAT